MAKVNEAITPTISLNEQLVDFDDRNDGLADDDSWVENTSQCDENLKEFDDMVDDDDDVDDDEDENDDNQLLSSSLNNDSKNLTGYCHNSVDFTLHTIVEESCEDSEVEGSYDNNKFDNENDIRPGSVSPTDLERYFFYDFDDQAISKQNYMEDSSSEIFSDLSDSTEQITTKTEGETPPQCNPATPSLENYFLSEFMGFSADIKSDSSVGSDSEGQQSLGQRKKRLRARRTPRSNHSSFDNLLETVEQGGAAGEQSNESLGSSESDNDKFPNEGITCDNLDNINLVKRKKNYRKRDSFESTTTALSSSSLGGSGKNSKTPLSILITKNQQKSSIDNLQLQEKDIKSINKRQFPSTTTTTTTTTKSSLARTDSFNNWSSDEETNIMMSRMKQFFKTLVAVKTNNPNNCISSNSSPDQQSRGVLCKSEAIQFPYLENELIRLMKTVPGINNQQLREIVEYFSSEEAWSDSNDSSDLNGTNIDLVYNKNQKDSNNDDDNNEYDQPICQNVKTEQLLVNIWQHIGQKLINLMREDSIRPDFVSTSNSENNITEISNLNERETNSNKNTNEEIISLVDNHNQQTSLLRSHSHDLLLGTTTTTNNRNWHSYSNSAVNDNTGETSDCDRFSWRGSFESALLAPGDSRNKLLTTGRESNSRISQWSLLERGSVDNLWCTNVQNRKHLNRVQSCGSIAGKEDLNKCLEVKKLWLSTYVTNKTNEESFAIKTIQDNKLCTNSLPRLQSFQDSVIESNNSEYTATSVSQLNVKSARYRSPAMQSNINSISCKTKGERLYGNNSLHKNITSSISLGDFSLTELNGNVDNSPILQRKSLYKRNKTNFRGRSESLTSVCSDYRYENVKVKGQVEFGMQYNYKINALEIHIVQCKDLAAVSSKRCKSDPYVKVYLLPDLSKLGKRKTRVRKQTLNPIFDETLRFHLPISKLKKCSIWLTVWNSDLLGRNDFLGEVIVKLEDKVFDKPQPEWYTLQQKSERLETDSTYYGDLVVALKFTTSEIYEEPSSKNVNPKPFAKGKLHILVKEAKYLFSNRTKGTWDTFCKSYLLPNRSKSSKQKTHVIKKSSNPMWNFTFVYEDLTVSELSKRALELTVWDHDRLISNQFIGGVRFSLGTNNGNEDSGIKSYEKETLLWREMINRPNFWVEGTVKLRLNLNDNKEQSNET
ncbi:synaptotagmin-like protein 2 isoform X2 [Episyrphus balteatus]|uniref:synaptotagmin-like protein 2 isoform X2 n=1 Tax=Episyrphus balteatus TaxID=286459 RepID=UPI0024863C1B|nr:synaptotagmin-like protein 2 isoform X2 [Episyrphus balteatus]